MIITERDKEIIKTIRFPLAFMVVVWHVPNLVINNNSIWHYITMLISESVTIAVPSFFFLSGFLFFKDFSIESTFNYGIYLKKMKSRLKTILIPYLLWNSIGIINTLIQKILGCLLYGNSWHGILDYLAEVIPTGFWVYEARTVDNIQNILGYNYQEAVPVNVPMWFIRDLFMMMLLSPVWYYLLKYGNICKTSKTGGEVVFILLITYICGFWTNIPGFENRAICFYILGAFFAVNHLSLVKIPSYTAIIAITSLIISVIFNRMYSLTGLFAHNLYTLSGTLAFFPLFGLLLTKKFVLCEKFQEYNKYIFCIYGLHTVSVIYVVNGILRWILGGSSVQLFLSSIFTPFLTVLVVVLIYEFVNKKLIGRSILSILSGKR